MQTDEIRPGKGLLEGKVVVVTAAAGTGIGSATAERCRLEGASVVISDIHEARLRRRSEEMGVLGVPCDVTADGAFDTLLATVESEVGPVDVLINNAGLGGSAAVVDMTNDQWQRVQDVTLGSAFQGTRAAMQRMIPRGRGAIVNVASVTGWRAEAGQAHYAAAKAGVMALTRCAGVEAAPFGVRVNAVAPTLAMHAFLSKVSDPDVLAMWAERQPQGRAARPEEIADVIVFLASDYSTYMAGEVISVGGQHP